MRRLLAGAALLYSAVHVAVTGVRQPLANVHGDFLASFPAWGMAFFFGRLDLYNGSLASRWGPPPIWLYGPVLHVVMIENELDQSLAGIVGRLAGSRAASGIAIAVALIALCALMLRVRRSEDIDDLEWGVLVVAMVLLPPHNEQYYFVFLLFPYLMLYARHRRARRSWRAALAVVSFVLVAAPVPLSLFGPKAFSTYLQGGIPFVGAVSLAVALVAEIGMSCAVSPSELSCPSKKPSRISALS